MRCPKCGYGFCTSEDVENKSQREFLMYQCDYCGWIWIVRQYGKDFDGSQVVKGFTEMKYFLKRRI